MAYKKKDTKEVVSKLKALFIEFVEKTGTLPFHCSVIKNSMSEPSKNAKGDDYKGINSVITYMARILRGFDSNVFITCDEVNRRGGHVNKGEHGVPVVWPIFAEYDEDNNRLTWKQAQIRRRNGEKIRSEFKGWREWTVFNLAQTNLEYEHLAKVENTDTGKNPTAEELLSLYKDAPKVVYESYLPKDCDGYYRPSKDEVHVLPCPGYETPSDYYFALFHEMMHSTEHEKRLNLKNGTKGTKTYMKFELRAEIGAMISVAHTDLPTDFRNSMAYVKGWVKKYVKDVEDAEFTNLITNAFASAQKGFEYMVGKRETNEVAA